MPPRNTKSAGRDNGKKSSALFDEQELLSPPYRKAVISAAAMTSPGASFDARHLKWMLGLAHYLEILLMPDDEATAVRKLIGALDNASGRVKDKIFTNTHDYEQYFISAADIPLVISGYSRFQEFRELNEQRKKSGRPGYDILCHAPERPLRGTSPPIRAFAVASAGGTFNVLHEGHQEYLKSALRLADKVHILISDNEYARERKSYRPQDLDVRRERLRKYLRTIGSSDRVEIKPLVYKADIEHFVKTRKELDVVITERAYFDWFDEWNKRRGEDGLQRFDILCRERTVVRGIELSSSMLTEDESAPRAFDGMAELFTIAAARDSETDDLRLKT
jgi:cytidyltransferase-like protein